MRFTAAHGETSRIRVVGADGTGDRAVTSGRRRDFGPDWSPDGERLVFHRVIGNRSVIHVMRADGTALRALRAPGSSVDPAWSPDGTQIVFASGRPAATHADDPRGQFDLYVMNADGSGVRRITWTRNNEGDPDWQPRAGP